MGCDRVRLCGTWASVTLQPVFQSQCLVLLCLHPHCESLWAKQVSDAHWGGSDGAVWLVYVSPLLVLRHYSESQMLGRFQLGGLLYKQDRKYV